MKANLDRSFDCVAFKHSAQQRIYEQTRGMSPQQRGEYLETQAERGILGAWWKKAKAAGSVTAKSSRPRARPAA